MTKAECRIKAENSPSGKIAFPPHSIPIQNFAQTSERIFSIQKTKMRKYIAEFIGTFFLVLTVGCTVIPAAAGVIPALAIGAVLMVMVFAGGHISGGHFNPAVTFAIFIRGRLELKDVVPYWLAQIAAGIAAAFVAMFLVGKSGTPMEITNVPAAFVAEFLFTFALAYVVAELRDRERYYRTTVLYGLAIGFTVLAGDIRSRSDFWRRVQSGSRHRCGGDENPKYLRTFGFTLSPSLRAALLPD